MGVTYSSNSAVTYEPIQTYTVTGSAVTRVTFYTISQAYTDLRLVSNVKDVNGYDVVQYNNDTANNYSRTYIWSNGTTVSASNTYGDNGHYVGAETATNTFGPTIFDIADYTNTTNFKAILSRQSNTPQSFVGIFAYTHHDNGAITRLDIFGPAGATLTIAVGSTFTLYGIKAA